LEMLSSQETHEEQNLNFVNMTTLSTLHPPLAATNNKSTLLQLLKYVC